MAAPERGEVRLEWHHARTEERRVTEALEGIRVVEVASYVAGPYAAMLLGDLGAEVVKIEPPPAGDPYRSWDVGPYGPIFASANRNKRSIVLDLRSPSGQKVARKLVDRADVLVENARSGAMDRLGLGYETVRQTNPRLIYLSITGFGDSGPYAHRPGYDTLGQAMGGLLSLLTDMDDPQPMGMSISDHLAGLYGAYGVLAALAARERTGQGQKVDTSLLRATVAFVNESMTRHLATGEVPLRETRVRAAQVFAFNDRDGRPFVVHLSSPDKFFHGLLAAIERPELAQDSRFATRFARQQNREALIAILQPIFSTADRKHWLARLEAEDVPAGPMNRLDEVVADPQVQHLRMVREATHPTEGPQKLVASAVHLDATPTRLEAAPTLDQNRDEILAELGFPADYLEERSA
jgi:crotonobetainyl-CoA:carnitine CoA-transferase CaiB-like acyl-CoA transferase